MAIAGVEEKVLCYHCGDECDHIVGFDEKSFCCEGCRTVYEILHDNDMCTYYDMESSPGISLRAKREKRFEYLDNPSVVDKLLDFSDDRISIVSFYLPQVHCSSCIWLLENLHKLHEGIEASRVNFMKKEAAITFVNSETNLRGVAELLASIGYAPEINLEDLDKPRKKKIDRTLIYQLGIAGFCFGNIMLISLPEYFGLDALSKLQFSRFFGYINILLAIPVAFYSARDYFRSAFHVIRNGSINIDVPIALGIAVLFLRSAYEIISHTGLGYMDSLAGLVFFLLLGKVFQQKTYHTLSFERDYKSYFPVAVTKLSKNGEDSTPVSELKKGDRILVRNDELIPVDCILISEEAHIDNSFVTGESRAVRRNSGDKIFAGGKQTGQAIELEVINELSQSYLTRIWEDKSAHKEGKSIENLTDNVSKYFTVAVLAIATASLVYWLLNDPSLAFNTFTAVLIIACPCALALSAPFTMGNVLRVFGKGKFYVKNAAVVESMARTDQVVFDKTGTLTSNHEADIEYWGESLSDREKAALRSLVRQSTHPLSKLLYHHLPQSGIAEIESYDEIKGKGLTGMVEGMRIQLGSFDFVGAHEKPAQGDLMTRVYVRIDGDVRGFFSFKNKYRQGLNKTIEELKPDYSLSLISGDNEGERAGMEKVFGKDATLLFDQKPDEKSKYIKKLKSEGRQVMMIGDGLNDAGALMNSHTGISISEDINTFSPACDAILDASQFHRLPEYIRFSKLSVRIIIASFVISFLYNITGMIFAVQGLLSPVVAAILMPLSSITVVAFVTASTNVAARLKKIG